MNALIALAFTVFGIFAGVALCLFCAWVKDAETTDFDEEFDDDTK